MVECVCVKFQIISMVRRVLQSTTPGKCYIESIYRYHEKCLILRKLRLQLDRKFRADTHTHDNSAIPQSLALFVSAISVCHACILVCVWGGTSCGHILTQ